MVRGSFVLVGAIALGCAQPASAARYVATYSGIVESGFDSIGTFGQTGDNLAGIAFEAIYVLDDGKIGPSSYVDDIASGKYGWGNNSPISAELRIGSASHVVDGSFFGQIAAGLADQYYNYDLFAHGAESRYAVNGSLFEDALNLGVYAFDGAMLDSADYRQAVAYTLDPTVDHGISEFRIRADNGNGQYDVAVTSLRLRVTDFRNEILDDVAAVPEPSSWALLISGFGLVGGALRRRPARPLTTV